MANSLLLQFEKHPRKRDLIGKLILAYGELEIAVMDVLKATLNGDSYTAVRALYRLRSESNRLEVADALVTPKLAQHKLDGAWNEAYAAMKDCKTIRNNYAHGQWINDKGQLRFGDLDKAALTKGPKSEIKLRPISMAVLKEQMTYFEYTEHQLMWIGDQYRLATGQRRLIEKKVPRPKKVLPPRHDSRGEARARQSS